MAKYKLGGIPVELDNAGAGVPVLHPNRTLFVQKLTTKPPKKGIQIVEDLQTEQEVFDHFKPSVNIEFQTIDGKSKKEEILFKNRGHFGKNGLINQTDFLKDLDREQQHLVEFIKKVKSDKFLQKALSDQASRSAFIDGLKSMIQIMKDAK